MDYDSDEDAQGIGLLGLSDFQSTVEDLGKNLTSQAMLLGTNVKSIADITTGKFKAFVGFGNAEDEVDEYGNPLPETEKIIRRKQTQLLLTTYEELISELPNKALSNLIEGN